MARIPRMGRERVMSGVNPRRFSGVAANGRDPLQEKSPIRAHPCPSVVHHSGDEVFHLWLFGVSLLNSPERLGTVRNLMRALFAFVLAWSCLVQGQGGESTNGLCSVTRVFGQDYVNLQDWANANKFQLTRKDEEVKLTNRWARLSFKLKSQRAEVNGVTVFLSYPVVAQQGAVWVAQKDLKWTFRPILSPPKSKQPIRVVALSAGHGGKDAGYQVGGQQEKKYTLLLAQELEKLLSRAGLKPLMIRDSDKFIEREARIHLAKRGKADLYLDLHYNCAGPGNTESKGVEVYCLTLDGATSTNGGGEQYGVLSGNRQDEKNMMLAYQIHLSLVEGLGLTDRGVRRARFEVLRDAEMPAVLIESGFMSQPEEMRRIQDLNHRRHTAQAILDGILAYKRLLER